MENKKTHHWKGELNPNWKGGVAEYKNHGELKRIRKIILEEAGYKCFYCGMKTKQVHHLDHSKDNHAKENLVACCYKCNLRISPNFGKPKKTSKYKRLYGHTLSELKKMGFFEVYKTNNPTRNELKQRLQMGM